MARVGVITGSGTYALPDFEDPRPHDLETPFGATLVTEGRFAGAEVLHVSRHGEGHKRLSNHVNHRANIWALRELGAEAVIGCTACGAVDPDVPLGSLIVFDDLHFLANRLPDGELCTLFREPGDPERGHWIIGPPYADSVRSPLLGGAHEADVQARDGGCYGHVDGPRFNTPTEIRALAAARVTAVSQTGGPETVLCGEAELPFALMGYATDYANAVRPEATPVEELIRLMGESTGRFAAVLREALPRLDAAQLAAPGTVYRFEQA
jgi:purine nucleoside phosphorylase